LKGVCRPIQIWKAASESECRPRSSSWCRSVSSVVHPPAELSRLCSLGMHYFLREPLSVFGYSWSGLQVVDARRGLQKYRARSNGVRVTSRLWLLPTSNSSGRRVFFGSAWRPSPRAMRRASLFRGQMLRNAYQTPKGPAEWRGDREPRPHRPCWHARARGVHDPLPQSQGRTCHGREVSHGRLRTDARVGMPGSGDTIPNSGRGC
jgi:hypothetical protein